MKLYYVPKTRATRPRWLLEELGVPFELVRLDPAKGETRTAAHLLRHPLGHVPALEDGEVRIFESAAICLYLADKYPEKKLVPPLGSLPRALCYQWIFFAVTELEPPLSAVAMQMRKPEAERDAAIVAQEKERFGKAAAALEPVFAKKLFLLGTDLSVADVIAGTILLRSKSLGILPDLPAVDAYLARLEERPARQRANAD